MTALMVRVSDVTELLSNSFMRLRTGLGRAPQFGYLILAALLAVTSMRVGAADVLPIPALAARVIDQTGTLTPGQTAEIEQKLATFERTKGSQIVVLMVPTTKPEEISGYANRVGNAWKIGRKAEGDGVLLIVAKNDRRVRIEVAKSLEGAIPDLAAKQIIDSAITPNFKAGNFAAGISAASDLIMARIATEGLPAGESPAGGGFSGNSQGQNPLEELDWLGGAIFLLFAVPFGVSVASAFFGRKMGSVVAGAGVGGLAFFITASIALTVVAGVAALVWALLVGTGATRSAQSGSQSSRGGRGIGASNAGWGSSWGSGSGGFGSSGGGGGFSSGGGGDFGGGGSSGDW